MLMDRDPEDARLEWFRGEVLPLEPRLFAYACRLCSRNGLEPEDLVHEAFLKLMTADNWREIDSVLAFAIRTLHNLAMSALRHGKVVSIHAFGDLGPLGGEDDRPNQHAVLEGREELRELEKMVAGLPPQCRRVFTLRKIYNLPISQVAEQLGISVSTAEKHLTKALRICSEKLARRPLAIGKTADKAWRSNQNRG
jgi:RNA polymerase sigma-70 factor (ECF subfamily)